MPNSTQIDTLRTRFKHCLIANFTAIVLMFAASVITGYVSRSFSVGPNGLDASGFPLNTYSAASKLALFVGLPGFIAAFAGLLQYKAWARRLYSFLMVAWGSQAVVYGVVNLSLTWGLSSLLADVALLTSGAVLAMSYLTPLSDEFESTIQTGDSKAPNNLSSGSEIVISS